MNIHMKCIHWAACGMLVMNLSHGQSLPVPVQTGSLQAQAVLDFQIMELRMRIQRLRQERREAERNVRWSLKNNTGYAGAQRRLTQLDEFIFALELRLRELMFRRGMAGY